MIRVLGLNSSSIERSARARTLTIVFLPAMAALMLGLAAQAWAGAPSATKARAASSRSALGPTQANALATGEGASTTTTTSTSSSTPTEPVPGQSTPSESSPSEATTTTGPVTTTDSETSPPAGASPQVEVQSVQTVTPSRHHGRRASRSAKPTPGEGNAGGATPGGGGREGEARTGRSAPPPSRFKTPSLPSSLGATIGGLPSFFIESFQVPPFLLPIYEAAGTAYGVPWQVLAAINEIETDYGRDLSVSSAGAEGWMQFLPSTWTLYGVDANGAGYEDPYNPADAIFAAARYLRAAGAAKNIRAAVYSYNHSQAYVDSVMLRAQLLGGTPPELLGAIAGLTESQFPVHALAHFADGFQSISAHGSTPARILAGTTIYSQAGAPVVAVQDGEVVQVGDSPMLGHFVALRDAYANTYVYAELGSVSALYPVLAPRQHTSVSRRIDRASARREPAPSSPATAGAQPRSPLSASAAVSSLALGATAGLEPAPAGPAPAPAAPVIPAAPAPQAPVGPREFRSGPDDVYLHPLRAGVQVLAGTVLGHVGTPAVAGPASAAPAGAGPAEPHILFQIKPAGTGAPLIDPKPILDGWVALEDTSIFRAKGENPFLATSPTVGQVLLESKSQLEQQIARDKSIHMRACERQGAQAGRVGRPVLAMLEYLSVSGLAPTVTGLRCAGRAPASEGNAGAGAGDSVEITAIDGTAIAGHQGPGSIADTLIRKLAMLQGLNRPRRIVSQTDVAGAANVYVRPNAGAGVHVSFAAPARGVRAAAASASAQGSGLTPGEWVKLIARLGEIPDPTVAGGPSSAAIPDGHEPATGSSGGGASSDASPSGEGGAGGNG
jgi:hypothetical protein